MTTDLTKSQLLERRKYVAQHVPQLLAHILSGVASTGQLPDPVVAAKLAKASAEAMFDSLIWVE